MNTISISFHQKLTRIYRWHHLLKGSMLEGKRNRRMDNRIYVLLHKVIPHFRAKHRRQQFGFKGPDLEVQHRGRNNLTQAENTLWISTTGDAYPSISYCKHICAIQLLFPESVESRPFTSIDTLPNNDKTHKSDVEITPVPKDNAQTNTTLLLLCNKLQALTVRIRLATPQSF